MPTNVQDSTAANPSGDARADAKHSHLDIPMSTGLALNPPSPMHTQMQNGILHGGCCTLAVPFRRPCTHTRAIQSVPRAALYMQVTVREAAVRWNGAHGKRAQVLVYWCCAGTQQPAARNHDLNFCVDQLFPEGDFDPHGLGDEGLADVDLLHDLNFELDGTDPAPM